MEIFNFQSKFLNFKGVSPRNQRQNPKKCKIIEFHDMMKGGIIKYISRHTLSKFLSVDGKFQFLVEILEFKGANPRNQRQNPKKIKIIEFHFLMKGGIIQYISRPTMSKKFSVDGNFQFLVKILEI